MLSQISEEIKQLVERAKTLENVGRYEEAAKILSKYWKNINELPNVSELNQIEQAEILLRCGSLAGYIGSCKQKKGYQELAQTLITEAKKLFSLPCDEEKITAFDEEKITEYETYLASTYQRMGQLDEARIWINSALEHDIAKNCEVRLYVHIVEGLILFEEGKHVELVNKCKVLEPLFRNSGFLILQGDFNNNYAYGLMKLDKKNEALTRFELAKQFYKRTKHYLYLALLENNLAVFFQKEEFYIEAHKHAKAAREAFKKLGDKTREGYSIDTQAQIYLAQGKYEEALKCANEAITMLKKGENYCYLVNSMETKSRIELELKDYKNYAKTIVACINIASIHISHRQADKFIDSLADLLSNLGSLTK
jgi:tetratricopeptide (TPR) repeat protein